MKRVWVSLLGIMVLAGAFLAARAVSAQEEPPARDQEFEQAVYDKLELINPEAVPVFIAATEAMDRDDYASAIEGYLAVWGWRRIFRMPYGVWGTH